MKGLNSRLAIGTALVLGLVPLAATTHAQRARQQKEAPQPAVKFSKEEQAALIPVEKAMTAKDFAAAKAALAAAQPVVQGADAKFQYHNFQLQIGQETNDNVMFGEGLEGVIASGRLSEASLPKILRALASVQIQLKQNEKAEATMTRYLAINANDADGHIAMYQALINQKKIAPALASLDRAIMLKKAAGETVPEEWYRVGSRNAVAGRLAPQAAKLGHEWVTAYPKPESWREVLINIRDLTSDRDLELDVYRLMRATKSLKGDRDYDDFARALSNAGYPGEMKAVLDEALAAKAVDAARFNPVLASAATRVANDRPTLAGEEKKALAAASGGPSLGVGNAYFGYGDYAKAIELYRTALKKGSVDANVVNTRLGIALALAGQKAEAEAAFKSVGGARSELAGYFLVWLAQRG